MGYSIVNIALSRIGNSTYSTIQDLMNFVESSGVSGGADELELLLHINNYTDAKLV